MGRKGYNLRRLIKKELKHAPKSGKELKNVIMEELGDNYPEHVDKTFNEALIKLLENEDIKIVDYNPLEDNRKPKSKQNFKSDPLVFDSTERLTRPKIQDQLMKMDTNDDAYQKIRFLFKTRLKDFNDIEKNKWNNLNSWVFSMSSKEIKDILAKYYDINKIYNQINKLNKEELLSLISWRKKNLEKPVDSDFEVYKIFNKNIEELLVASLLSTLSAFEEYENFRVWFYPVTSEKFNKMKFYRYRLHVFKNFESVEPNTKYSPINDVTYPLLLKPLMVDTSGEWAKEEALQYSGFYKPSCVDNFNLEFENSVDIISTYSKEENIILKGILAKGLSDEPGSKAIFWDFYKRIKNINYNDRINRVLGVLEEDLFPMKDQFQDLSYEQVRTLEIKRFIEDMDFFMDLSRPL